MCLLGSTTFSPLFTYAYFMDGPLIEYYPVKIPLK